MRLQHLIVPGFYLLQQIESKKKSRIMEAVKHSLVSAFGAPAVNIINKFQIDFRHACIMHERNPSVFLCGDSGFGCGIKDEGKIKKHSSSKQARPFLICFLR